jgi:hypothetical protein
MRTRALHRDHEQALDEDQNREQAATRREAGSPTLLGAEFLHRRAKYPRISRAMSTRVMLAESMKRQRIESSPEWQRGQIAGACQTTAVPRREGPSLSRSRGGAARLSSALRLRAWASALAAGVALAFAAVGGARADALPGRFEVGAGGNVFALFGRRCEQEVDVVGCSDFWPFAGFEVAFHTQATSWMSVGLRAAGGKDLDRAKTPFSDGSQLDRDLWLWRGSAEFRFDPPIWPRGIWIAGELGAAMFVDAAEIRTADDRFAASASTHGFGVLAGVAVGWDFAIMEHVVFGTEARGQYISAPKLDAPEISNGRVTLEELPYVSLAVRGSYRW